MAKQALGHVGLIPQFAVSPQEPASYLGLQSPQHGTFLES